MAKKSAPQQAPVANAAAQPSLGDLAAAGMTQQPTNDPMLSGHFANLHENFSVAAPYMPAAAPSGKKG